jgi:hypothetical protein
VNHVPISFTEPPVNQLNEGSANKNTLRSELYQ